MAKLRNLKTGASDPHIQYNNKRNNKAIFIARQQYKTIVINK